MAYQVQQVENFLAAKAMGGGDLAWVNKVRNALARAESYHGILVAVTVEKLLGDNEAALAEFQETHLTYVDWDALAAFQKKDRSMRSSKRRAPAEQVKVSKEERELARLTIEDIAKQFELEPLDLFATRHRRGTGAAKRAAVQQLADDGFSLPVIAAIMGLGLGTVRSYRGTKQKAQ